MTIIEIAPLSNGAHRNQTVSGKTVTILDGWAVVPNDMTIPDTFPFVDVTAINGVVTRMSAGVVPAAAPQEAETSAEDDTESMLIDHEYRLTLLELGLSE